MNSIPKISYEFRWSREFSEAINPNPDQSSLTLEERELCYEAVTRITQLIGDKPIHELPDLKPLRDSGNSNLYLYRLLAAARNLNIVLAIDVFDNFDEDDEDQEGICVFANAGIQDAMERWAEAQYFDYDPILASPLEEENPNAALERARREDFQSWTQFLYPRQRYLAEEFWSGPAQIRGSAGTGKTVIGLHYAATLARRYPGERILYTTKRSLLNQEFHERFRQLEPELDSVDFRHLDDLAYDLAVPEGSPERESKDRIFGNKSRNIDRDEEKTKKFDKNRDDAFDRAYKKTIDGTDLEVLGQHYLKDEIELIILGNGFRERDEYTNERRAGRFPLSDEQLSLVWRLHESCNTELAKIHDETNIPHTRYADNLLTARDVARARPKGMYRSVIVDEALDFNLVGMQLIRALVAGKETNSLAKVTDSILILSSVAQQIYAGGYSLAEAGIDIGDRDCLLDTNYRNVGAIHEAAAEVRGTNLVFSPLANPKDEFDVSTELERNGRKPCFIRVASPDAEIDFISKEIVKLLNNENDRYRESEIAILARRDNIDDLCKKFESRREINLSRIASSRAGLADGVRISRFRYAKGFEFRAVFMPCMAKRHDPISKMEEDNNPSESRPASSVRAAMLKEAKILEQGRLYAAMTRARDRLYLIADSDPIEDIRNARSKFDWQDQTVE